MSTIRRAGYFTRSTTPGGARRTPASPHFLAYDAFADGAVVEKTVVAVCGEAR